MPCPQQHARVSILYLFKTEISPVMHESILSHLALNLPLVIRVRASKMFQPVPVLIHLKVIAKAPRQAKIIQKVQAQAQATKSLNKKNLPCLQKQQDINLNTSQEEANTLPNQSSKDS